MHLSLVLHSNFNLNSNKTKDKYALCQVPLLCYDWLDYMLWRLGFGFLCKKKTFTLFFITVFLKRSTTTFIHFHNTSGIVYSTACYLIVLDARFYWLFLCVNENWINEIFCIFMADLSPGCLWDTIEVTVTIWQQ